MVNARDVFRDNVSIHVRSDLPGWVSLTVSPNLESKTQLTSYFREQLSGLPDELCEALVLAIDELIGNAMEHGCGLDPNRCMELGLVRTGRMILFHVRDDGGGFSIESIGHAAVNNPPNNPLRHAELRSEMGLRPGGFGILLVQQVADELIYNENGNEVLFIKYLDAQRSLE